MPRGIYKHKRDPSKSQTTLCLACQKPITSLKSEPQIFCDRKCRTNFQRGRLRPEVGPAISKAKRGKPSQTKGKLRPHGHPQRENLVGRVFERLTVLEFVRLDKGGNAHWKCKCLCGNFKEVCAVELKNKTTRSCGCIRREGGPKPALSKTILKKILEGTYHPQNNARTRGILVKTMKGGEIRCHSSWEDVYAKYLDNNDNVVMFEKDKVRIPYVENGKRHIYIVDFILYLSSRIKKILVEVKPKELIKHNLLQFEAAEKWSIENNIPFIVVTNEDIAMLNGGKLPESFRDQGRLPKKKE